ncbi:Tetratricopeptide TPR1 [Plasmopara halstedii]|uniref:Tetratricopeptide TPR1 n=1 Tax=Plasmopara halstedii TaxID=4781 RepID=A0A0P1B495_PLAHL|nr:Tetratricopeptide TPR1 [Plasmopara halstedii]CEG49180.1 Tetratricopeptide TPR1 [Plasmopara halstedii]|eukprot:XP_024585549.1 Tetratricopeptide TPR1 [Plasmopara halstedii]
MSKAHASHDILLTSSQVDASSIDQDQKLLEMLSSTVVCLQEKKMHVEALGCLEQSLWLKRRMFGVESSAVHTTLNDVILRFNSLAMELLATEQYADCITMLRKAEAIIAPGNFVRCQALQILTFNNLGCCYRKLGNLRSALKYLQEAARIGAHTIHVKNLSITHLNLCAIQSQLNRHDLALEHAQAALFHSQEELVQLKEKRLDPCYVLDERTQEEKIICLAVAYHNLAVELEFNQRGDASLQWYKKALQLVWKYRATNESLYASFRQIFRDAKMKQETANIRNNGIPESAFAVRNTSRSRPQSAHAAVKSKKDGSVRDVSYSSTVASQCYKSTRLSTSAFRSGSTQKKRPHFNQKRPNSASSTTYGNKYTTPETLSGNTLESHWDKLEREHHLKDTPPKMEKTRRVQSASTLKRRHQTQQKQTYREGQLFMSTKDSDMIDNDSDLIDACSDSETAESLTLSFESNEQEQEFNPRSRKRPSSAIGGRYRGVKTVDGSLNECLSHAIDGENEAVDLDLPAQRVRHLEYVRRMKKLADSIKDDLHGVGAPVENMNLSVHGQESSTCEADSKVSTPRSATSKLRDEIKNARCDSTDQVEILTRPIDEGLALFDDSEVCRSECAAELKLSREAVVCRLQALFRGRRSRAEVKQLQQVKIRNDATIRIQRQVRRHLKEQAEARRLDNEKVQLELQRLEVEDMAACLLQRLWRRGQSRKEIISDTHISLASQQKDLKEVDVSTIETEHYNDDWESPRLTTPNDLTSSRELIEERQNAAIRIQAFSKSAFVRIRLALEHARLLSRMYIERQHFSVTLTQAMALEHEFLYNLSVIKIQALVRGHQSRLIFECYKAGVHTAAVTVQRAFRIYHQRTLQAQYVGVRSIAARTIQDSFRDYKARKMARHQTTVNKELLNVYHIAADSIQKFWKRHVLALNYNVQKVEAATCIQALIRGHLSRKSQYMLPL